jgi:integrase/recombinase XerD
MSNQTLQILPENDLIEIVTSADIDELLQPFIESLKLRTEAGEISAATATAYERGVRKFLAWSVENTRNVSTSDAILRWKAALLNEKAHNDKPYTPATVNAWLAGVKALCAWAVTEHRLPYNPAANSRGAKRQGTTQGHKRENLTGEEVRRLVASPDTGTKQGLRDLAILTVMLKTALRGISIHRADVEDLQTVQGLLVLQYQGKGRLEKMEKAVIMDDAVVKAETALRDWLALRGAASGPLFVSLSKRSMNKRLSLRALRDLVTGYMEKAGVVGNKSTHSLRHTAITKAVSSGQPLERVMTMAGHANPATTMIYYHEENRMKDPVEAHINYDE